MVRNVKAGGGGRVPHVAVKSCHQNPQQRPSCGQHSLQPKWASRIANRMSVWRDDDDSSQDSKVVGCKGVR